MRADNRAGGEAASEAAVVVRVVAREAVERAAADAPRARVVVFRDALPELERVHRHTRALDALPVG